MEWGGTGREVMLSEQKDWKKINQKWASMLSHMSLLNIFSALVVWLLQYFITSRCSVLRFFFFVGNASKNPNKQCYHHSILCQVNIFFSYIHVELQQYEHSCSMHRPRATLGSSAVSYPPPCANTVRISLAWVLLPLSCLICQSTPLIKGKEVDMHLNNIFFPIADKRTYFEISSSLRTDALN